MTTNADLSSVKACVFDVFGTVVDWRRSIIAEGEAVWRAKGVDIDWAEFVDAWRAGYHPAMDRVRTGELPWTTLDVLHRMQLDELKVRFGITLDEADTRRLNLVWHRLHAWPGAPEGLARLKQRHVIAPLSNGNLALLTNMGKFAGLPWDCVLGSDVFEHFKPDPAVYRGAVRILGLEPHEVVMCAAHGFDLVAAAEQGLRTAYVHRPDEYGPSRVVERPDTSSFDVDVDDFDELATALGA